MHLASGFAYTGWHPALPGHSPRPSPQRPRAAHLREFRHERPAAEHVLRALQSVTLDDKYALDTGRAFMSGVQAWCGCPCCSACAMRLRGSTPPAYQRLPGLAARHLRPGLDGRAQTCSARTSSSSPASTKELGATAVWGTQQLDLTPDKKRFDGVFGLWYGKGPGVDRCIDVFKHANMAGTAKHGGVIAIAGDDHIAKEQHGRASERPRLQAAGLPVFFPSVRAGHPRHGPARLRAEPLLGALGGHEDHQEIVESSSSISIDPDRVSIVWPEDFEMPPGGLHIRWPDRRWSRKRG